MKMRKEREKPKRKRQKRKTESKRRKKLVERREKDIDGRLPENSRRCTLDAHRDLNRKRKTDKLTKLFSIFLSVSRRFLACSFG